MDLDDTNDISGHPVETGSEADVLRAADQAVRELYERFPYPPPLPSLDDVLARREAPFWNPRDSFPLYFPEQAPRRDLDILVAGCGTRMAPIYGALMPEANVVGIDISGSSLASADALCRRHGVKNVELHEMPLERVKELGRTFDMVHCFGVLHHLADPVAGLKALGSVTRPSGMIAVMVYAQYGRTGVYLMQRLAKLLSLQPGDAEIQAMQRIIKSLPLGHPLSMLPYGDRPDMPAEEIADMLLHPRDVAYDVAGVKQLVDGAGMKLHRWLGHAQYDPELSPLAALGLTHRLKDRSPWERAAAMEAFWGKIWQHVFLVSHHGRATAADLFEGIHLVDAVPSRSPHAVWREEGTMTVLTPTGVQVPLEIELPTVMVGPILDAMNGRRSVATIVHELVGPNARERDLREVIAVVRRLYWADIIELRRANEAIDDHVVPAAWRASTLQRSGVFSRPRPRFGRVRTVTGVKRPR